MKTWSTFEFKLFTKKRLTQAQVEKILEVVGPGEIDGYALAEQPMEVRSVLNETPPSTPVAVQEDKPPHAYRGPLVVHSSSSSHAAVAEIVQGPAAYDLFVLVEEDRKLLRMFSRTPKLWDRYKFHLDAMLMEVGPRYVRRSMTRQVILDLCQEFASVVKRLVVEGEIPEMAGWLDTFQVVPVKLANADNLSKNPFAPRLVPYDDLAELDRDLLEMDDIPLG